MADPNQQWTLPALRALLHQKNYEYKYTANGITSKCHVYKHSLTDQKLELWEEPKGPILLDTSGKLVDPLNIPAVNRDASGTGGSYESVTKEVK